jgi:uncharacterized protein (DUF697 family)
MAKRKHDGTEDDAEHDREAHAEAEHGKEVAEPDAPPTDPVERRRLAEELVQRKMLYAMAAGLIPAPGIDVATGLAIQLTMLNRLTKLYGVDFSDNLGRSLIGSLMASGGAAAIGMGAVGSAVKAIPVVGTVFGVVGMPILLGAYTYAVGKVFIAHFESGGTLLDFNVKDYRKYWDKMVSVGRRKAKEAKAAEAKVVAEAEAAA